ncbi:hypothetical protein FNV43_RR01254 [Rhamnella rubrinervis]|uniref:Ribosomal RNA small subunit methyltransferase NEP1 n=1 Tax=Rhamnella rubrinervis TaxID=2594499 RepID=A0A8K0HRZ2_9ROSA|nr:hypothetical protein FNV43_RR01254 [Rhamnella rubrinervis]
MVQPHSRKRNLKMNDEDFIEGDEFRDILESATNELRNEDTVCKLPGIPLAPCKQERNPGVIFVLEKASLVLAFVGRRYQILNPEEHAGFLRRKNMDPYKYRPDIVHEALRNIFESRLCLAGRLEAVYIKTDQGILIKVEPNVRIPESLVEFCAMMSQLLQKFSIKAKGKGGKLLRVVENPVTQYLPVNSLKIGLSSSSRNKVNLRDYVGAVNNDVNLVFVVGAMAHGSIDSEYTDDLIAGYASYILRWSLIIRL